MNEKFPFSIAQLSQTSTIACGLFPPKKHSLASSLVFLELAAHCLRFVSFFRVLVQALNNRYILVVVDILKMNILTWLTISS